MKSNEIAYLQPGDSTPLNISDTPGIVKNRACTFGTLLKIENAYILDNRIGLYLPAVDDLVIGKVFYKSGEYYKLDLCNCTGMLPCLAFKNATKRFRPELEIDDFVLCRVTKLGDEALLTCNESDLGKLAGFVFVVEPWKIRKLYFTKYLDELGLKYKFECAMGINGRIWIDSKEKEVIKIVYDEIIKYQ